MTKVNGKRMIRPSTRAKREDGRICVHEAAHLVASCKLKLSTPRTITVEPGEDYGGRMTDVGLPPACLAEWKLDPANRDTCQEYDERNVMMMLAGLAAEVRRGRTSMAESTIILFNELRKYKTDRCEGIEDVKMALDLLAVYESNLEKRQRWFFDLWRRTFRLVGKWWSDIRRVAAILQERRTLDRDGIFEVYNLIGYSSSVKATNE